MSLAVRISDLATRIGTEFKAIRTLIGGSGTADISALNTTVKTSLVAAINEVNSKPPGTTTLAALTDTTITTPAAGHILRHDGTDWKNVLGSTHFQPADSDLTAIAALSTTAYGRALLTLADQAALVALIPGATETASGIIELATQTEVNTGTDTARAVTPATLQAKLGGYQAAGSYQPLDSDLTAIAALTTTTYGRAFLALADQTALMALMRAASETVTGVVELATAAETTTGTDSTRAVHPAGFKTALDARIVNDATLGGGSPSTTNAPSVASVKSYADALIGANDAMVFKGVIDASANPNYPAANRGDTYRISVAGKIGGASGPNVEVGDILIALTDGTAAGTHATVGSSWNIVQTNIDGAVTGPASSGNNNIAIYSGTTGKVIADSGMTVSSGAIGAGSTTVVPTTSAVAAYAQPLDATLTALAGVTTAADRLIYATGADAFAVTTFTAFGRSLVDDADAATARTTLGLGTAATQASTAFQSADAELSAIAGLVSAANTAPYFTGSGTAALMTVSAFGRSLIDDADAATARGTLGVYSTTEIGDPETDFVATFVAALA